MIFSLSLIIGVFMFQLSSFADEHHFLGDVGRRCHVFPSHMRAPWRRVSARWGGKMWKNIPQISQIICALFSVVADAILIFFFSPLRYYVCFWVPLSRGVFACELCSCRRFLSSWMIKLRSLKWWDNIAFYSRPTSVVRAARTHFLCLRVP